MIDIIISSPNTNCAWKLWRRGRKDFFTVEEGVVECVWFSIPSVSKYGNHLHVCFSMTWKLWYELIHSMHLQDINIQCTWFIRGLLIEGMQISLAWISKVVLSYTEKEAKLLLLFYCCVCSFPHRCCGFQTIFMLFLAIIFHLPYATVSRAYGLSEFFPWEDLNDNIHACRHYLNDTWA